MFTSGLSLISSTLKTAVLFVFLLPFRLLSHSPNCPSLLPPSRFISSSPPFFLFSPFIFRLSSLFHGALSSSVNMTELRARGVRLLSALPPLSSSSHGPPADTSRDKKKTKTLRFTHFTIQNEVSDQ